ncbi:hypothetical protein BDY19DRAFT_991350 [Irpex rosettiformis]|uniref:Uncharacterized protein n=1 Tax=Irpex rosettiformis TaxID=378272 RepID=A0ACB8UBE7_9APHY|nr:hypothetical protein BDY19DRAFT_991350 [Irpex rosettiformis]
MPRRRANAVTPGEGRMRNIHTYKTDLGLALLLISRSTNHGPRVFTEAYLLQRFYAIKQRRDGKIGKHAQRLFQDYVEELITRKFLTRHSETHLSITDTLRGSFRSIRHEIRELNIPPHRIHTETVRKLRQLLGPQNLWTKQKLNSALNEYIARDDPLPRAPPLQAWSSMSTVDGTEPWGELQFGIFGDPEAQQQQTQETWALDRAPVPADQLEGGRSLPSVGPPRSPVRSQTHTDPSQSYPTPESARRPSANNSRSSQRGVPSTPTPAGRSGRDRSQILDQEDDGDMDMDMDEDGEEDRGEGRSKFEVVRRIFWGQPRQAEAGERDRGEGGSGTGHQCEFRHELDDLRERYDKKSHDEKAVRSEKERLTISHDAVLAQREALSRERDAIREDRDAVVVERNHVVRERDALRTRNVVLEGENATLTAENAKLEEEKVEWMNEKDRLLAQVGQLQSELDDLHEEKAKWEEEKEVHAQHRHQMEERIRMLEDQVTAAEANALRLEEEKKNLVQGRQTDVQRIVQLQRELDESRASFSTLHAHFQTFKDAHDAVQLELSTTRDLLRQRSDELARVTAHLQTITFQLGSAQNDLRRLHESRQAMESDLHKEIEEHQVTKQMLEQERRDLNRIIQEREGQLRQCRGELLRYDRLTRLMGAQREACLPLVSGHAF